MMNEKKEKLHSVAEDISEGEQEIESGGNSVQVSNFLTKEELIEYFSKSGSVINVKDKFLLKTPSYGGGWDLYEIKKTNKETYTSINIGYNKTANNCVKKIIEIVIKNKGVVYPDLNAFLDDYRRIEKTLTNILP